MGVVPRNPESVTSSTVSPMERTRVALVNDTTINASYSSEGGGQKVSLYIKQGHYIYYDSHQDICLSRQRCIVHNHNYVL